MTTNNLIQRIKTSIRCYVDRDGRHPCQLSNVAGTAWVLELAALHKHALMRKTHAPIADRCRSWKAWQMPLWIGILVYDATRQYWVDRRRYGRRLRHALPDICRMILNGIRFNFPPRYYYMFRLHQNVSRELPGRFIPSPTFGMLCREMSSRRGLDVGALDEKRRFYEFCRQHRLPTIPVIEPEQVATGFEHAYRGDLFVKCVSGYSGSFCWVLEYASESDGWRHDAQCICRGELFDYLDHLTGGKAYILQPRLRNMAELVPIVGTTLSTVRALTARGRDGRPLLLRASLRMALKSHVVDNFSQGGIAAAVDVEDGTIGKCFLQYPSRHVSVHPLTGEPVAGRRLPRWEQARELVIKAHSAADGFNFLGWDIAFTDTGVLLVECNSWPEVEIIQLPQDQPLLDDAVLECMAFEFGCS